MRIIKLKHLRDFWIGHADAEPGLRKWAAECLKARWRNFEGVKDRHGLRQKDLCPYIGSEPLVSAAMNGTRSLSKPMIVNLHDGLGIPYEDLMTPPERPRYRKVAML